MSIEDKKNRLAELAKIPAIARMDHRHMLDSQGNHKLLSKLTRIDRRKVKREARKVASKYKAKLLSISRSGAGYPVDKLLKHLAIEYTKRYMDSGVNNQPTHFNYFEPFCKIALLKQTVAPYAEPIEQLDNLFSIIDYFEYITSEEVQEFKLSSLLHLPENTVFHYTTNGHISDLTFLNAAGREFVISGFSLVRRKNSLHWYLLGGEVYLDDEWEILNQENYTLELDTIDPLKRAFLQEAMEVHGNQRGKPLSIEGMSSAIRTVVAGEINLKTEKYYSRIVMQEYENIFQSQCDDPEIFPFMSEEDAKTKAAIMEEQMEKASVMWDLVGSMFALPLYFESRVNISETLVEAAGNSVKPIRNIGGKGARRSFERVPSLQISDKETPKILMISPTYYPVETEGYWRRLKQGTTGKGPDGKPEENRTWIKARSKFRTDREPKKVYIKSTLKSAKLKAEEYFKAANEIPDVNINESLAGFLYVLRCAAMKEEVYKVGYTDRTAEIRASELSANTATPKSFIVVNSWQHKDAKGLETNVHAMLDPYRLNERREFFNAPYKTIEKIIEQELERLA